MGAPRSTTRDLERYAGLFARRTQVDEVVGDARPDGGHRAARGDLARRRPAGHEHVPGRGLRRADGARRGRRPAPRRSSTARPRASTRVKECIVEVMAAEGMHVDPDDLLVTTGGQQVIDLVCKTLIDPGDVVIAEAPTYPGAVPTFCSYQADVVQIEMDADGMRIDLLEETLDRLDARGPRAEVHLHGADVPEPGRRDDVAGAAAAAGRDRAASASCSCSRTTRTGCCATRATRCRRCYSLDGGEYVIYLGTFSKILSPGCASAGPWRRGRCSTKMNLGKRRRRPLLVVAVAALRRRLLRASATGGATCSSLTRALPPPARHDARRARRALPARGRVDATRRAGCSSGRRCPTTSTPPTCWRARCARTSPSCPGAAAYLDGRGGSSMRLNFSGVGEDDIREGMRRIGKVVARAGRAVRHADRARSRPRPQPARRPAAARPPSRADVVAERAGAPAARSEPRRACSRAAARSSARSRCAPARGSRTRSSGSATRWSPIDVGPDLVERLRAARARRRVRRAARPRRRGRHRAGAARDRSACPTPARAPSACIRCMDKVLAKHAHARRGHPDARLLRLHPDRVPRARRRRGAAGDRGAARLPDRRQARRRRARRSGSSSPATAADVPGALVAAFSYDTKVLLERHVAGPRPRGVGARGPGRPEALPVVEAVPREEDFYDFEARYEIGRTEFVCPADCGDETTARAQELALARLPAARLLRLRPRRPDARGGDRRAVRARGQRDPGPDRDVAAAAGRRGGGDRLRRADRRACSSSRSRARRAEHRPRSADAAASPRRATAPRRPGSPRARPGRGTP